MSKLSEYIEKNKKVLYSFADNNTPKNDDGKTVIQKQDEWRNETEWDSLYKKVSMLK